MAHVIPTRVPREVVLFRQVAPSGGVASFDITGIPADCDVIKIYLQGKSTHTTYATLKITFNGDTTDANYRRITTTTYTSSTSSGSGDDRSIGKIGGGSAADNTGNAEITLINPRGPLTKSILSRCSFRDGTVVYNYTNALYWENTAVINQITLSMSAGNFAEGSLCIVTAIRETELE